MKPIKDFDKVQAFSSRTKLPAGGYEAKIIGAKEVDYGNFSRLEIALDITAGEFKDYYKNDFDSNSRDDKKWRGVARFYIPTDDGSDKDNITKSVLKGMVNALEDSNKGFHWDWDESKLKGLKTGILVRDKEWKLDDGKTGFSPEIFKFIDIADIKAGKFEIPKPKYLSGNAPAAQEKPAPETAADDDYPF